MTEIPAEEIPSIEYIIKMLEIEQFRVFLQPQRFFFEDKRNLVVFGPNKSGKTC